MGVRASISKHTSFIYLAFEKMDPFIYLIVQNDLLIYCPLIFIPIYCWQTNISINSLATKRTSSVEKISERKIYAYNGMSEKWGLSHMNQEKSGQSYTFC